MWPDSHRPAVKYSEEANSLTSFAATAKVAARVTRWNVAKMFLVAMMAFAPLFMDLGVEQDLGTQSGGCVVVVYLARVAYVYIGGAATYVILSVCQSTLLLAEEGRRFLLLVLFLAAPVTSRMLLWRLYHADLAAIECKEKKSRRWVSLKDADPDLQLLQDLTGTAKSNGEEDGDRSETNFHPQKDNAGDYWKAFNDKKGSIERKDINNGVIMIRDVLCHTLTESVNTMVVGAAEQQLIQKAMCKFKILDLGLFWLLRKKLKAYCLTLFMQIQTFLTALFLSAGCVFLLGLWCKSQEMQLEMVMAICVFIVVVGIVVKVFNTIIGLNNILNEDTIGVLLNWKDLFERARRQVKFVEGEPEAKQKVQSYFDDLKFEVSHVVEQIKESEAPMSFFGFPVTKALRNTIVVAIAGLAFQSIPEEWKNCAESQVLKFLKLNSSIEHDND
jgi:hypothetical protein